MEIESQLYQTMLLLGGVANLLMAFVLYYNSYAYTPYVVYRRARLLTALSLAVFGLGFMLHYLYLWRTTWIEGATALSVSYFHIGGVLLSWSHISLLNPNYPSRRIVVRDIVILVIALVGYWNSPVTIILFFAHISWLTYTFYHTYYKVTHQLIKMHRRVVEGFMRWMLLSCHLIILSCMGSILVTALMPESVWPYTVLLIAGMAVFIYIFYSLTEYGSVIDSATDVAEDVVEANSLGAVS